MIVALLPAFNEEQALPLLVPKLAEALGEISPDYKIVVCNDGSTDRSTQVLAGLAATFPLEVIEHRYNRGLGESARDLIERAVQLTTPGDFVIRMDCDDTHEPRYIRRMVERAAAGADVVIASRYAEGGGQQGVNAYRRFISRMATLFMRTVFPIGGLREYTSGFRVYRAAILHRALARYGGNFIQLRGLGFTCTLEKLVKLNLLGATFAEEAFVLRYDQKVGESKMVASVTTFGYFAMAVLYHWPWGGWKAAHRRAVAKQHLANDPVA